MPPNIRLYLKLLWDHWGDEVSGKKIALVGLVLLAGSLKVQDANAYARWTAIVTLSFALLLLVVVSPYNT